MGSTAARKHLALKDLVNWFEIPAYDIHRAATFYNAIYNMEMEIGYNGDYAMAFFPAVKGVGGAIVAGPGCVPNDTGTLIYLNTGDALDDVLARVELAGGRVIMTRTMISETAGSFALFIDSEGNRLALHEGPTRSAAAAAPAKPAAKTAPAKKSPVTKKAAPKKAAKKKR